MLLYKKVGFFLYVEQLLNSKIIARNLTSQPTSQSLYCGGLTGTHVWGI